MAFKFENLNHTNRVRDRKRKSYNLFLDYLDSLDDSIKNKELQKLREYLVNTDFGYQYRPISTRERLVADAKFNNTSEDFSKINWDSAYHEDYKKFYPEN